MIGRGYRRKDYDTATGPSMGRSRRLVSAWAGLFLLLFNVLAGSSLQAEPTPNLADNSDHLIVCTAGGMAVIDRNGTPVAPEHAGQNGFCGYCLPLLHGAALATASLPLPEPFFAPTPAILAATGEIPAVSGQLRLALARAPPQV